METQMSTGGETNGAPSFLAVTLVELERTAEVHHSVTAKTSPQEGQYGDRLLLAQPCSHNDRRP